MTKLLPIFLVASFLTVSCRKDPSDDSAPEPLAPELTVSPVEPGPSPGPTIAPVTCQVAKQEPRRLTGLKPMSSSEQELLERNLKLRPIRKIRLNALGLKRLNSERRKRGLSPLSGSLAREYGQETEVEASEERSEEEDLSGALPRSVDNSSLPAFPAIGQQAWSSCVGWAMGYYQWSHNNGLAMGWDNKTSSSKRCSPKFVYSMINDGVDGGAYFSDAFNLLQRHGCATWDRLPEDNNFRQWSIDPEAWRTAIAYRSHAVQYVKNVDTATGLEQVKQLLNNGFVLTFGTYIESWQFTTIKADPSGAASSLAGAHVLRYVNGTAGSHAMTVVGYDDDAWVDINSNGSLEPGERGVLKVANSWGTKWKNAGFVYVAYDALKSVSAVPGGPTSGRGPAFQSKQVYHLPVRAAGSRAYVPKYLAKFTLKHVARNQLSLKFGWSGSASSVPVSTISPFALMNKGGGYAFDGGTSGINGTFVMDISELLVSEADGKFYLTVTDNKASNPVTISDFEVIDLVSGRQVSTQELSTPVVVDSASKTFSVSMDQTVPNLPPVAKFWVSGTEGVAPLVVDFDASASVDPDGAIESYSWNFGDGSSATGPFASKTFTGPGSYLVILTVKDTEGISSTSSKLITVAPEPGACQ